MEVPHSRPHPIGGARGRWGTHAAAPTRPSPQRLYELDWLRVAVVLAVAVYHVLQLYGRGAGRAKFLHARAIPYAEHVLALTSYWRMPLLFCVAGAACVLALGRKPVRAFVADRVQRLLVPLGVGLGVVTPLQVALEGQLRVGGATEGFVWGYTWFLACLALITAVALPLCLLLRDRSVLLSVRLRPQSGWFVVGLGALPVLSACLRARWGADRIVLGHVDGKAFALYLAFFVTGAVIGALPALRDTLVRVRHASAGSWLALATTGAMLRQQQVDVPGARHVAVLVQAAAAWAWVAMLYGYARHHLAFSTPWLRRFAPIAFAFYLLHGVVLAASAWLLLPRRLPLWMEFSLLVVLTIGGTWMLSRLVAATALTRYLFGLRRTRP